VAKFKYQGMEETKQICMHEEIKSRLNRKVFLGERPCKYRATIQCFWECLCLQHKGRCNDPLKPTKKLTKGAVFDEVQGDYPCTVVTFLHTKHMPGTINRCLINYKRRCAYVDGFACIGWRPWYFQPKKGCCYWWKDVPSCSLVKVTLVRWLSGS
jgi:hypothetical protein